MGLEILGPLETGARQLYDIVSSQKERARREASAERGRFYADDYRRLLEWTCSTVFREPEVYRRIEPLIPLIGGSSFLKRVADELGRPLYARAPIRRVIAKGDAGRAQDAWNALAAEMDLDAKMDTMTRLLTARASVFAFVRYVPDLGMQLDVMTPDMVSVLPHPRSPTRALAIAYVSQWKDERAYQHTVWDDKRYFTLGPRGGVSDLKAHDFGVLPFVEIHQRGRTCHYWQETLGQDLVSQTRQSMFLDLVTLKKIKQQSHIQLTYSGDIDNLVKDQVSDEESVLVAHGNGQFSSINLESDPGRIQAVKAANEAAVASNWGISRDRLNQKASNPADDVGLYERVAELAAVMVPAEKRIFEIVQRVAREHPEHSGAIPDDARLLVDLGQIFNRVDRATQLAIRQTERSMGGRSGVDDVLEDNPEFGGDRELAMRFIDEKMAEEALIIARRRALNMPADATAEEPGQDPAKNGAMGPAVRDGEMTRDAAAEQAASGYPQ